MNGWHGHMERWDMGWGWMPISVVVVVALIAVVAWALLRARRRR